MNNIHYIQLSLDYQEWVALLLITNAEVPGMEGCRLGTVGALVSIQCDYKQCIAHIPSFSAVDKPPYSFNWLLVGLRITDANNEFR